MDLFARDPKIQKGYDEYRRTHKGCLFCDLDTLRKDFIEETELWLLVENKFPYKRFKEQSVCLPKRHVENITRLTMPETVEMVELMSRYNNEFRILINDTGTQTIKRHFHFHLIKT